MTPSPTPEPVTIGLNDLGRLTSRGLVAIAARAARRALPLYRVPADDPGRVALVAGLAAAEDHAREGTTPPLDADGIDRLYAVAEAASEAVGYAGFAPVHAARAGVLAARAATEHGQFLELIASAFGALRVLYANSGVVDEPLVLAALRADFDTLVALRLGPPAAAGGPIDPSEGGPLGPLWPAGHPSWFPPPGG